MHPNELELNKSRARYQFTDEYNWIWDEKIRKMSVNDSDGAIRVQDIWARDYDHRSHFARQIVPLLVDHPLHPHESSSSLKVSLVNSPGTVLFYLSSPSNCRKIGYGDHPIAFTTTININGVSGDDIENFLIGFLGKPIPKVNGAKVLDHRVFVNAMQHIIFIPKGDLLEKSKAYAQKVSRNEWFDDIMKAESSGDRLNRTTICEAQREVAGGSRSTSSVEDVDRSFPHVPEHISGFDVTQDVSLPGPLETIYQISKSIEFPEDDDKSALWREYINAYLHGSHKAAFVRSCEKLSRIFAHMGSLAGLGSLSGELRNPVSVGTKPMRQARRSTSGRFIEHCNEEGNSKNGVERASSEHTLMNKNVRNIEGFSNGIIPEASANKSPPNEGICELFTGFDMDSTLVEFNPFDASMLETGEKYEVIAHQKSSERKQVIQKESSPFFPVDSAQSTEKNKVGTERSKADVFLTAQLKETTHMDNTSASAKPTLGANPLVSMPEFSGYPCQPLQTGTSASHTTSSLLKSANTLTSPTFDQVFEAVQTFSGGSHNALHSIEQNRTQLAYPAFPTAGRDMVTISNQCLEANSFPSPTMGSQSFLHLNSCPNSTPQNPMMNFSGTPPRNMNQFQYNPPDYLSIPHKQSAEQQPKIQNLHGQTVKANRQSKIAKKDCASGESWNRENFVTVSAGRWSLLGKESFSGFNRDLFALCDLLNDVNTGSRVRIIKPEEVPNIAINHSSFSVEQTWWILDFIAQGFVAHYGRPPTHATDFAKKAGLTDRQKEEERAFFSEVWRQFSIRWNKDQWPSDLQQGSKGEIVEKMRAKGANAWWCYRMQGKLTHTEAEKKLKRKNAENELGSSNKTMRLGF